MVLIQYPWQPEVREVTPLAVNWRSLPPPSTLGPWKPEPTAYVCECVYVASLVKKTSLLHEAVELIGSTVVVFSTGLTRSHGQSKHGLFQLQSHGNGWQILVKSLAGASSEHCSGENAKTTAPLSKFECGWPRKQNPGFGPAGVP